MLYLVTYSKTSHQVSTGLGPFTTERSSTTNLQAYVDSESIQRIPDAIANFCTQAQIVNIEKLSDKIYRV